MSGHTHVVGVAFEVFALDDEDASQQVQWYVDNLHLNGVRIVGVEPVGQPGLLHNLWRKLFAGGPT